MAVNQREMQAQMEQARLHSIIANRAVLNMNELRDALNYMRADAQRGSQDAQVALQQFFEAVDAARKQAESPAAGRIVVPGRI